MQLKFIRSIASFFFVFFTIQSFAQFKLNQPLPVDPNVKIGKLANGLTYYIRKNSKPEKRVELRLAINAGAVLEDNDQRGLAHFMEHMSFNGSKHFPKNELVDYLQKVGVKFGADLNAYTGFDETVYILPIPSDDPKIVEQGFTVLEDWAFNNLLDKNEIEKERGVVLEESRMSKGADERMSRQYFPRLFNGSRYAERLPIGKDSILKNFKHETLKRFYKQWYRPNLMAVIVVGDIDPVEAEKKIKAHFSHFKNPANAKPRPSIIPIKARTKSEAMVLTDQESTNAILQVYNFIRPAKKINTWNDYRKNLIESLVNSLINQRLQELTQKENPPFVAGFTGMQPFLRGYETFVSAALLGNNSTEEAVNALFGETEKARKFGFLSTEIERAKANMMNEWQRAYAEKDKSESSNFVQDYLNNFLQGEPIPGTENQFKFLKQILPGITMKEVNDLARQMPPPTNAFALITAPASMKDNLPTADAVVKNMIAASKREVKPYEEKAIAANLIDNLPASGKISSETKNEKVGITDLVLSNGVKVTLKTTNYKNDEVVMNSGRWGGWNRFPLADKDNARYATQIVTTMGVKDLTPTDLDKFLSGKTVSVYPFISGHEEGISGSSSIKDIETLFQLVHLYFTQPRKDQALFNSFITKSKSQIKDVMADPGTFFSDTLTKVLYNGNPWATGIPSVELYEKLNADKALEIYKEVFSNADGMHFNFVGNIDLNTIKPLIEKYLGSLPAKPSQSMYKDNGLRPVQGIVNANIKKGKEPQSQIKLIWTGETEYNRNENLALRALIDILNIQVNEKLREELGGMYTGGFNGGVSRRPYMNYNITATVPCGPENVEKLTAALFEIIKNAQEGKIEQKDLDKVKETSKKQHQVAMQQNNSWVNSLYQVNIDKQNPENILDFQQRLDALTLSVLQKAAQKFFNMKNYVKAVLYPENANVQGGVMKTF